MIWGSLTCSSNNMINYSYSMTHILGVLLNRFFFQNREMTFIIIKSYKTSRKSTLLNKRNGVKYFFVRISEQNRIINCGLNG